MNTHNPLKLTKKSESDDPCGHLLFSTNTLKYVPKLTVSKNYNLTHKKQHNFLSYEEIQKIKMSLPNDFLVKETERYINNNK